MVNALTHSGAEQEAEAKSNELPPEVLQNILSRLDSSSMFNASFTCRRWLTLLAPTLPTLEYLHVDLNPFSCNGRIIYRNVYDTSTTICQCNAHGNAQNDFLREIFQLVGRRLTSVAMEDGLLADKEAVRDSVIHTILGQCQNSLTSLGFHHVDMSYIQPWTIALLAKFSLESIEFIGCKFPVAMNESLFIRTLSPSFNNLEILTITDTELITDKIAITVAKKCPKLREFNVRGCRKVTAVSAVAFCEGILLNHDANPVTLDLRNTSFKASELSRHLHNSHSLLHCGASWKAQSITLSIGFDRSALVLENTERNDLVIVIYV